MQIKSTLLKKIAEVPVEDMLDSKAESKRLKVKIPSAEKEKENERSDYPTNMTEPSSPDNIKIIVK